jgi:hypothetical protein
MAITTSLSSTSSTDYGVYVILRMILIGGKKVCQTMV